MKSNIKDPCISICQYDENEICLGCRRTKTEAKTWWRMKDDEKIKALKDLIKRDKESSNDYNHYV